MDLAMEKKIVLKNEADGVRVYASHYYYMELNTARMLHDLNVHEEIADVVLLHRLHEIEKNTGMVLDEMQKKAVMEAARHGIMVLTGGPGTGKTTTINADSLLRKRRDGHFSRRTDRESGKTDDGNNRL